MVTDAAAMRIEGATCQALRALQTARPASKNPRQAFSLGAETLGQLPAAMGPAVNPADVDRRTKATAAGKSWTFADPEATLMVSDAWTARVKGGGWMTELKVLARGDFDGDGYEDILFEAVSTGTEGRWSDISLRLLTTASGTSVMRILREYQL